MIIFQNIFLLVTSNFGVASFLFYFSILVIVFRCFILFVDCICKLIALTHLSLLQVDCFNSFISPLVELLVSFILFLVYLFTLALVPALVHSFLCSPKKRIKERRHGKTLCCPFSRFSPVTPIRCGVINFIVIASFRNKKQFTNSNYRKNYNLVFSP